VYSFRTTETRIRTAEPYLDGTLHGLTSRLDNEIPLKHTLTMLVRKRSAQV